MMFITEEFKIKDLTLLPLLNPDLCVIFLLTWIRYLRNWICMHGQASESGTTPKLALLFRMAVFEGCRKPVKSCTVPY